MNILCLGFESGETGQAGQEYGGAGSRRSCLASERMVRSKLL